MTNINEILSERAKNYGSFSSQAELSQNLKNVMRSSKNWTRMSDMQRESLEMIAHKIARILNGDPNYEDSWVDIGGYANLPLVVKQKHLDWVESLRNKATEEERVRVDRDFAWVECLRDNKTGKNISKEEADRIKWFHWANGKSWP